MSNNKFTIVIDGVDNATPVIRGVETEAEKLTANLTRINGVNPASVRRPIVQAIRPADKLAGHLDRISRGLNSFGAKGAAGFVNRLAQINRLNTPPAPNAGAGAAGAGAAGASGAGAGGAGAGEAGAAGAGAAGAAGSAGMARLLGPLAAIVALGEAARVLTRSFGESSTEILNNARALSMTTGEYQKLVNMGRMLKVSPDEINNGMFGFALAANKAGKGFDPAFSYAQNVLGVKTHRIGGNDNDLKSPIDTGRLLKDVLNALRDAKVSPTSKMEALQQLHLPASFLNMTNIDPSQQALLSDWTNRLSLSPEQLEKGRRLDVSNTAADIVGERGKQELQETLSPLSRFYNDTKTNLINGLILGNAPGSEELYPTPGQKLMPQAGDMQDATKPRPILLPPMGPSGGANAPSATPAPVEVHITNNGTDTHVRVKQGGMELPVRVHNSMSMDPQ